MFLTPVPNPVLDINKIYEGLYQGSIPPPGTLLQEKKFDVLVLTAKDWQNAEAYPGVTVVLAPGDDDERPHRLERFLPTWKEAAKLVAEYVNQDKKVLVTCMAGQNRSGLVTALALHELTGWSGTICVQHVRSRRTGALCNATFEKWLCENVHAVDRREELYDVTRVIS